MKLNTQKLVIFLGFPLIILASLGSFGFTKQFSGVCTRVIDGDTIIVGTQKIRLKGIDAPELAQKSLDHKPIGQWSYQYLLKLIEGKRVEIKYDKRGYYGRIIGEVFLEGKNVNLMILAAGMAIKSRYTNHAYYRNTELQARLNRQGIFATDSFYSPWYYRKKKATR